MASIAHPRKFSTLMGYLAVEHTGQIVETSLFKGAYLRFGRLLMVCLSLYETGAILGRARRDKLSILARTFPVLKGHEDDFINLLQENARERLEKFGKEPDSFFNFIMSTELEKANLSLTGSNFKTLKKAFMKKFPLKEAEPIIKELGLEGIGFGSCFPELTEKIWRRTYESIDMDKWSKWRSYGLALSEKPLKMNFEEQEQIVLEMVSTYVSEHYPELIDPLELHLRQS